MPKFITIPRPAPNEMLEQLATSSVSFFENNPDLVHGMTKTSSGFRFLVVAIGELVFEEKAVISIFLRWESASCLDAFVKECLAAGVNPEELKFPLNHDMFLPFVEANFQLCQLLNDYSANALFEHLSNVKYNG